MTRKAVYQPSGIVVVVDRQEQWLPLLSGAYRLATARNEPLLLFVVAENGSEPDWMAIPPDYEPDRIETQVITLPDVVKTVSQRLRGHPPTLVVLGVEAGGRSLVRKELDPLMQRIKCPVAIVKRESELKPDHTGFRMLVPFSDDENSRFAIRTALDLDPDATVTAAMVVASPMEDTEHQGQERELNEALSEWADDTRVVSKLLIGPEPVDLLVDEAEHHDIIVMGVGQGFVFLRAAMGDTATLILTKVQRALIHQTTKSSVVLRAYQGWFGVLLSSLFTRGDRFLPTLSSDERIDVYREIRRSARPTQDFFIMIGASASIASVGLILNSPAVIIGAMLIAPLMSAIIGMGLAIVQGDFRFFGSAAKASLRGILLAILVGLLMGILNIGNEPTTEMLARTEPSVLDFLVATVSGFAAAYALCRKDLSAALPGVAIAVALVPPLATVGLFAGMGMLVGAYGAFLLFATNLAAITLASGLVFTLLGFHPPPVRERDTKRYQAFQRGFLVAGLVTLAVFSQLIVLSVGKIKETRAESAVRDHLTQHVAGIGAEARLVEWSVVEDDDGRLRVTAAISSSKNIETGDLTVIAKQLEQALDRPVQLAVTRLPTATVRSARWSR